LNHQAKSARALSLSANMTYAAVSANQRT